MDSLRNDKCQKQQMKKIKMAKESFCDKKVNQYLIL